MRRLRGGAEGALSGARALNADDVRDAARRIRGRVRTTPVVSPEAGAFGVASPLVLKLELLQKGGSFKARGAFSMLLGAKVPAAGVIAASGGNHGIAVALAARALGHAAEVFVPETAAPAKVAKLRALGATVVETGPDYAHAREACDRRAAETGALSVPSYDHPLVIAGQGTAALEFLEQASFDTILISVGGGGLISGSALVLAGRARVIGVETEGTPTMHAAFAAGGPVDVAVSGLAADALGARRVSPLTYGIARATVPEVLLVSDAALAAAQRALWDDTRIACEPSAAAGLAALLSSAYAPAPRERVALLICGGNVDPGSLGKGN